MISCRLRRSVSRAPRGARGLKCLVISPPLLGDASRPSRGAWIEIHLFPPPLIARPCRAPRGARGLKFLRLGNTAMNAGRAPRGARGLKWIEGAFFFAFFRSRPSRDAWIEIPAIYTATQIGSSRAPRGARGLKYSSILVQSNGQGRAPRGARGLKSVCFLRLGRQWLGRAPRGARGLKFAL